MIAPEDLAAHWHAQPGVRRALDRAADRALARPGDWIAGALLAAVVLLAVAWGLREDETN